MFEEMVRQALRDRQPSVYRKLKAAGLLDEFVTDRADEIRDYFTSEWMDQGARMNMWTMEPFDRVALLNGLRPMILERVLAELLPKRLNDDGDDGDARLDLSCDD